MLPKYYDTLLLDGDRLSCLLVDYFPDRANTLGIGHLLASISTENKLERLLIQSQTVRREQASKSERFWFRH